MEFDEKDNQVINLLTKLKDAEGGYPVEMMATRRQTYMKQLAAIGVGAGAAAALKSAAKAGGGGSSIPPAASTLLETVLIVAIVAEAAAVAFINREKVSELVRTISNQPTVQEVADVPNVTDLPVLSPEPTLPFELTGTPTPSGTPTPGMFLAGESTDDPDSVQANSTPDPNDNNGNQYGLTPKPERTKEPGNSNKPKKDNTK